VTISTFSCDLDFKVTMEKISDVFETRRGKMCVIINSYKFSEFRKNKDNSKIFRRTYRKCTITVKISENVNTVISINGEHNHDPLLEETITKQTVMSILKRYATTDLNMKISGFSHDKINYIIMFLE